jgi:molybdopterin converting factor small subunit
MIQLKFFASFAETVGEKERAVEFRPTPFRLLELVPEVSRYADKTNLRVAVNGDWADWNSPLKDGDEVAFLPPLSGG